MASHWYSPIRVSSPTHTHTQFNTNWFIGAGLYFHHLRQAGFASLTRLCGQARLRALPATCKPNGFSNDCHLAALLIFECIWYACICLFGGFVTLLQVNLCSHLVYFSSFPLLGACQVSVSVVVIIFIEQACLNVCVCVCVWFRLVSPRLKFPFSHLVCRADTEACLEYPRLTLFIPRTHITISTMPLI